MVTITHYSLNEDKLIKLNVDVQVTMDTGVVWGLEATGILGDPHQQVFLILVPPILNPRISR